MVFELLIWKKNSFLIGEQDLNTKNEKQEFNCCLSVWLIGLVVQLFCGCCSVMAVVWCDFL